MNNTELLLEYVDQINSDRLESEQQVINDMIQESFKEWEYLDHCIKYNKEPTDLIQEGLVKNVKLSARSMFTRIRALLKRNITIFKTLFSHVKDVTSGFKGRFHKDGAKKSASQIAYEALGSKLDPNKKLAESGARVKVPYEGDIKQDEIALINSNILIKEFNDDNDFEIDLLGVNFVKGESNKMRAVDDKGSGVKSLASLFVYTNAMVYFIKNEDKMDELCDLITEGFKIINNEGQMAADEYGKAVRHLVDKAQNKLNGVNASKKLTMKELTAFQSKINNLEERLDFAQNGNNELKDVDPIVIKSLNDLMYVTENIQFGLNSISNAIQKVHLIDLKFMNSITDREALSKFVYGCIQNGIPPKFIAYNTWLIANESIRGSSAKYKPVGGQTRVVFFPNDNKKEILKIAISGIGVTSNKNEIRFAEFLKRSKEDDIIKCSALVTKTYYEDAILAMERVVDNVGKHPDLQILTEMKNKYKDFTARHPELKLVVTDFNDGNVMWSSDKDCWVCIDYGLGRRNSESQDKINKKADKAKDQRDKDIEKHKIDVGKKED